MHVTLLRANFSGAFRGCCNPQQFGYVSTEIYPSLASGLAHACCCVVVRVSVNITHTACMSHATLRAIAIGDCYNWRLLQLAIVTIGDCYNLHL